MEGSQRECSDDSPMHELEQTCDQQLVEVMIVIRGWRTVSRIHREHLLDDDHFLRPCSHSPSVSSLLALVTGIARSIWHTLQAPSAMIPDPVYFGVLLERSRRESKVREE